VASDGKDRLTICDHSSKKRAGFYFGADLNMVRKNGRDIKILKDERKYGAEIKCKK